MKPGSTNSILDVAGLKVGNASDDNLKSGTTVLLCDEPYPCSIAIQGGAPGTRETALLEPDKSVSGVDALVLSGGSAFGLDAASGVQAFLREKGRGFAVGPVRVPIVPGAILFDLINGGDKQWGLHSPYRELGYTAAKQAGNRFETGTAGAGTGALVAGLKGGLGTASTVLDNGATIGALVAVNALGSPLLGSTGHFNAARFEQDVEFGGLGLPHPMPSDAGALNIKFRESANGLSNTTIAIVATNATLDKAQCKRLAISAHDGIGHAIWPAHTPMDGDLVFGLATGKSDIALDPADWIDMGAMAASTLARAISRAVYDAAPRPGDIFPTYGEKFASNQTK